LGLADQISDDDMIVSVDKSRYEKRILALEKDREKTHELIKELIQRISELQSKIRGKEVAQIYHEEAQRHAEDLTTIQKN